MKYDLLLSDADGTLFDFLAGERNAIRSLFLECGLPAEDQAITLYSSINESHWKKLERGETTQARLRVERFQEFLQAIGAQGDPGLMSERYVELLGQQRILIPGALDLCRRVSQHMPIYLVTNGLSKVQRSRFQGCELSPYLSGFLISEEVGHAKPDPHMLVEAMRLCGVSLPRRVALLGDSVSADIGAAQAAGVDSILFVNGGAVPESHGATFVASTLEQAADLLLQ